MKSLFIYLFTLSKLVTNGLNYSFLNVISVISILCGIFVIVTKNPIVSALFLTELSVSIGGYLITLGINFIDSSYLLVCVIAALILFLFVSLFILLVNI